MCVACLTAASVRAVHADNGFDRAVQPQNLQGIVSGPHLYDHAYVYHHVAAQPHGLLLDLAGRNRGQGELLDAVYRYPSVSSLLHD